MTLKNILARLLVWIGLSRRSRVTVLKVSLPVAGPNGRYKFTGTGYVEHLLKMQPGDELTFLCEKPELLNKFQSSLIGYATHTFGSGNAMSRTNKSLVSVSIIRVR